MNGSNPSHTRAQGTAADEKKIIANEHMISESVMKKDLKMFHMMVDTEGIGVDGGGVTRVSDMDKMFQQMNITASNVDQEKVMWITPDVAVLTYRRTGKGIAAGQAMPGASYSSTVYAKQKNGDWIAKFHQESLIAPAPPAAANAKPAAPAKKEGLPRR